MKLFLLLSIAIILGIWLNDKSPRLFGSMPVKPITEASTPIPEPKIDDLVDTYSKKYGKTRYQANAIKVKLHFLLLKEQNYGGSNNCGDSGKACGPLQFHEPTYQGYRKIMMKYGLVTEVGSRLDMEDAIETTAWAISDGRETAWGPIARGEIKL